MQRTCLRCAQRMQEDLRVKVNGGGYGLVVAMDKKRQATPIGDLRVAVCPACGYTELYLEDVSALKKGMADE